jgi:hypothetical protein
MNCREVELVAVKVPETACEVGAVIFGATMGAATIWISVRARTVTREREMRRRNERACTTSPPIFPEAHSNLDERYEIAVVKG